MMTPLRDALRPAPRRPQLNRCASDEPKAADLSEAMHQLITIRISHYNEKARWALDRFSVPYVERAYMPGLHAWPVFWATRRRSNNRPDRVSTRLSTPVLITESGRRICDSRDISRYVSQTFSEPNTDLYPTDEVVELEDYFHDRVGPHTRRVAYHFALADKGLIYTMADRNVSRRQARWFRRAFPLLKRALIRALSVTPEHVARSLDYVRKEIDAINERLDGRHYLVGDRFTAADISLATMLAPALLVSPTEGYGAALPAAQELTDEAQAIVDETRSSPAGQFALRLFAEERGQRQIPCDPAIGRQK